MALCPYCSNPIDDSLPGCPHCGQRLTERPPRVVEGGSEPQSEPQSAAGEPATSLSGNLGTTGHLDDSVAAKEQAGDQARRTKPRRQKRVPTGLFPPMPEQSEPGPLNSLPYFCQVVAARIRRAGAVRSLKRDIVVETKLLQESYRDLGQHAQDNNEIVGPRAAADVAAIRILEAERNDANQKITDLGQRLEEAKTTFSTIETRCDEQAESLRIVIATTETEIANLRKDLAVLKARLAQEDRAWRALKGELEKDRASVHRCDEADSDTQATLQRTIAERAIALGDWERQRATTSAELDALRAPIEEKQRILQSTRDELLSVQKELRDALTALETTRKRIEHEQGEHEGELDRLERLIAEKLADLGRSLDEYRDKTPALIPLFAQVDAHRHSIEEHQARILAAEAEKQSYDRDAFTRGGVMLSAFVVAGAVLVAIVIAWSG